MGGRHEISRWAKGDSAVTPSGQIAVVQSIEHRPNGRFLVLRYRDALAGHEENAEFTISARYCAKHVPGLFRPKPVVIGDADEVAKREASMRRSRW